MVPEFRDLQTSHNGAFTPPSPPFLSCKSQKDNDSLDNFRAKKLLR